MAKTNIIHKPNELIALIPSAGHRLTYMTRLLYNGIILFTQWQGAGQGTVKRFAIPLKDLLHVCGLSKDDKAMQYRHVKRHIESIRAFGIGMLFKGEGSVLKDRGIGLIDKYEFIHEPTGTILVWEMDEHLQEVIANPKNLFTRLNLEVMSKLSTGASMALYEICVRYLNNRHKKDELEGYTGKKELMWWVKGLMGNPDPKLPYKEFHRSYLKKAIAEINSVTNIDIRLEEYKSGKTVTDLEFFIKAKAVNEDHSPSVANGEVSGAATGLERRLRDSAGLSKNKIEELVLIYANDLSYLETHLRGVELAATRGQLKNAAAWFLKALKENYDYSGEAALSNAPVSASHKLFENQEAPDETPKSVDADITEQILGQFDLLDADKQKSLLAEFTSTHSFLKRMLESRGPRHPAVATQLAKWLLNRGAFN